MEWLLKGALPAGMRGLGLQIAIKGALETERRTAAFPLLAYSVNPYPYSQDPRPDTAERRSKQGKLVGRQ